MPTKVQLAPSFSILRSRGDTVNPGNTHTAYNGTPSSSNIRIADINNLRNPAFICRGLFQISKRHPGHSPYLPRFAGELRVAARQASYLENQNPFHRGEFETVAFSAA